MDTVNAYECICIRADMLDKFGVPGPKTLTLLLCTFPPLPPPHIEIFELPLPPPPDLNLAMTLDSIPPIIAPPWPTTGWPPRSLIPRDKEIWRVGDQRSLELRMVCLVSPNVGGGHMVNRAGYLYEINRIADDPFNNKVHLFPWYS